MDGRHIDIFRKHTPFLFVLFHDHLKDVCKLFLRFLGSLASGVATWNRRDIGYEGAIVFRAEYYCVIIKAFHQEFLRPICI